MTGKFITLEGGEGSGKTTNLIFIKHWLEAHDIDVVVTREPGGTPIAEKLREVLLTTKNSEQIATDTELLLMFAARAQHVAQVIKPAIAAGKWVLCSRFTDSTYAYQGGGRGVSAERIATLESWTHGDFQPDVTLLLDLPVDIGMQRARDRAELDRIEQETLAFFERVRQSFLQRAQQHDRYRVIDAHQSLDQVQVQLTAILEQLV